MRTFSFFVMGSDRRDQGFEEPSGSKAAVDLPLLIASPASLLCPSTLFPFPFPSLH